MALPSQQARIGLSKQSMVDCICKALADGMVWIALTAQPYGLFNTHAGGMGMWVREKASMTGRRWRSIIFGRTSVKSFLHSEVQPKPSPEP